MQLQELSNFIVRRPCKAIPLSSLIKKTFLLPPVSPSARQKEDKPSETTATSQSPDSSTKDTTVDSTSRENCDLVQATYEVEIMQKLKHLKGVDFFKSYHFTDKCCTFVHSGSWQVLHPKMSFAEMKKNLRKCLMV
jgi:hypothetical protein